MNVLVDTGVWSAAVRRKSAQDSPVVREFLRLVDGGRVEMVGPIRQELLSGIRTPEDFDLLRERLASFPDIPIETSDYVRAAVCFNTCRAKGIQGSHTDFLISAIAVRASLAIFTTERDFLRFAPLVPISLHRPELLEQPGPELH